MKLSARKGFTLIEVMISMFIMTTLTILVSASIRSAVQNKKKLEIKIESETNLYNALRVLKMDIERAFNYQDVFFQIERLAISQLESSKAQKGAQQPAVLPPKKLTHFIGEGSSLYFTTLNHFRTKYNAQESNQMEVGYYLDSCKSRNGKTTSNCLWRMTSTLIDDDLEKGDSKVVLSENVSNFKLSYRSDRENEDWMKEWKSNQKGKQQHRNKFPHLVKIELAIGEKGNRKVRPVKQSIIVRVQFPNNDPLVNNRTKPPTPPGGTNP